MAASVDDDTVHKYCWNHFRDCPYYSQSDDGGPDCYLTSACVEARGLPDDCRELTILRHFRDTYIRQQPQGEADVAHYYAVAPQIVQKIRETGKDGIFDTIYQELVLPCVALIENSELEAAYQRYKAYSLKLEKEYLQG